MAKSDVKQIIKLAHELQALSSAGLLYTKGIFDIERYERIRSIAAELVSITSDESLEKAKKLFEVNDGYQTPKISTRAAIINEKNEVLLVCDYDNKWVMPGGWCDFNQSIMSNTIKEASEEAGVLVEPYRLVGLFDHRKRNNPTSFFYCVNAFVLCHVIDGAFQKNSETSECRYFSLDGLPELNPHKTTLEEISLCIEAHNAEVWEPIID